MKRILVVDSEIGSRESIRSTFWGIYEIQTAETPQEALNWLGTRHFDLLIFDALMLRPVAKNFLQEARKIAPEIPLIAVSAFYREQASEESEQLPSMGFICKPFDVFELRNLVARTLETANLKRHRTTFKSELTQKFPVNVIGESGGIQRAVEIAQQASQTSHPVLLLGEPGSGREFLARQIHSWSRRANEPFVKVENPGSDVETVDATIFGEVLNLTGVEIKSGAIDVAGSGAIFLNEAIRFPLDTRSRLKMALKSKAFHRVGSPTKDIPYITRFFISSDFAREPEAIVQEFMAEMESTGPLHIISLPPLRERRQDIPMLVAHYLTQICSTSQARMSSVEPEALQRMQAYSWPGNVQELRNVLERILVLHGEEDVLRIGYLPREIGGNPLPYLDPEVISFSEATEQLHRQMITSALKKSNGKIKAAADLLNLTPRILQHRIDKLDIEPGNL